MSFFDKLGKTVTNTAHSVVEKTKSSTETIRLNGLINDEEKNINAAYLNMGRKYAELHTADAEPEFQEFLSAIAASQEKIAEYREQIRKTKHLLICQGCGAEIPETVLYCTKCGAENPVGKQLAEERAAREAAERAQREAEAAARQAAAQAPQAPAGAECCPNCGKPGVEREKGWFCENRECRFVLWKDNAFFKRLGKRLDAHVADKLLRDGRVRLKDCKSAKGKTYNATVLLSCEADGRSKFSLEFEGGC